MRKIYFLLLCFFIFQAQAQEQFPLISEHFEIKTEQSKSGLMNISTGAYELPPEECFLYVSDFSNALLKVSQDDIEVYTYFDDSLRRIHQTKQKVLLSFSNFRDRYIHPDQTNCIVQIKDLVLDARKGMKPDISLPRYYHTHAELGVEVLGDRLIIQDRQLTGEVGTEPMIDNDPESPNYGENLIVTLPDGTQSFKYEAPTPPISHSGIYDLNKKKWILPQIYFGITPTYKNGFVLETIVLDSNEVFGRRLYAPVDKNLSPIREPFDETELRSAIDLFRYLIPHYKCDSVLQAKETRSLNNIRTYHYPVLFYSDGKVGEYDWYYNDIVVVPYDLYFALDYIYRGAIGVNDGNISFYLPYFNESFEFSEGSKMKFVFDYAEYSLRNGLRAIKIENASGVSEHHFYKKKFQETVKVDTSVLVDKSFESDDFNAFVAIEHLGNGLLLVNQRQGGLTGSVPLIDEDPNSPNFGENLIETLEDGTKTFVYDQILDWKHQSGIFDIKTHSWLIEPKYYSIERKDEQFIAHTGDGYWSDDTETTFDRKGTIISVKEHKRGGE